MTEAILKNPKLRFPEFEENWRKMRINQVTERVSFPVEVEANESYTQIGVRSHGKGLFHKEPVAGKELGNKRVFWVKEDLFVVNIVFAWEQAVAKTTKDEFGMIASHRFPMFRPRADLLKLDFLLFSFLTRRGKSLLELASPGGAGRNKTLGQEEFNRTKINIPCVEEQRKIAAFLSAVDKKIRQLAKKKRLLLKYKKGVMQQIFDQKIRFKDDNGNDFPDWASTRLRDVCQINPRSGELPDSFVYIDLESVESGNLNKETVLRRDEAPSRAQRVLEKGDILFQMVRPYQSNNLIFDRDGSFVASTGYAQIRSRIDTRFLFQSLLTYSFVKIVIRRCTGTSYPAINSEDLAEIKIDIPTRGEQEKIGEFLTQIDSKIDLTGQQIQRTKAFKRGLLQRMFV
jgi:type I restriction enzyme S subunit